MDKKEKSRLKLRIMNMLYYLDDVKEQDKMISILVTYNSKFRDTKFKDLIDKIIMSTKKDYFEKVDYLLKDIFEDDFGASDKQIITNMLNEIKPIIEKAQRTLWDQFTDLFKWS